MLAQGPGAVDPPVTLLPSPSALAVIAELQLDGLALDHNQPVLRIPGIGEAQVIGDAAALIVLDVIVEAGNLSELIQLIGHPSPVAAVPHRVEVVVLLKPLSPFMCRTVKGLKGI